MRWMLTLLLCCSPLALASLTITHSPRIDKVLVIKSDRQLHLISHGKTLKTYKVSLGKQPVGHKLHEGDKRTPEGLYWLDWRKRSEDRKSTRLNSSHVKISYAVFCLKKKTT